MNQIIYEEMVTALAWYTDQGLDICVEETPIDRFACAPESVPAPVPVPEFVPAPEFVPEFVPNPVKQPLFAMQPQTFLGKSEAAEESLRLAKQATTLDELRSAIEGFDGIALKRTASNMVFGTGNPKAEIMLVGEAPGADEDREGEPFVGISGQLLDKILGCIGLSRNAENPSKAIYISNILNWRPPGNRTPSPAEIEVSLPFIERHIQLISPRIIILCGGVSAKALLGQEQSISRLRNCWHDYTPITRGLEDNAKPVPAIATYHPSYLLRTPVQKKLVWMDILAIQKYHEKIQQ